MCFICSLDQEFIFVYALGTLTIVRIFNTHIRARAKRIYFVSMKTSK